MDVKILEKKYNPLKTSDFPKKTDVHLDKLNSLIFWTYNNLEVCHINVGLANGK